MSPAMSDVFGQHGAFPRGDVGPVLHEPLIVGEPRGPRRAPAVRRENGPCAIRHRMGRIGDVRVERVLLVSVGGSNDSLPFAWKYSCRGDETLVFGGHASYVRHSFAPASNVGRFGEIQRALVLEPVREPRRLNVLAIVRRRLAAEVDVLKLLSRRSAPAAVIPRADDEIVLVVGVVLLELAVDGDRAVKVFLVPPARDVERRHA